MRELKPPPTPYPPGYDVNAHCGFHMGAPGHTLENFYDFNNCVQYLVESIGSNVKTHPMSVHAGSSVNEIEGVVGDK